MPQDNQLTQKIADRAGLSHSTAIDAVDAIVEVITEVLRSGGEIHFSGFGKFYVSQVSSPTGTKRIPKFRADANLQGRLTKGHAPQRLTEARSRQALLGNKKARTAAGNLSDALAGIDLSAARTALEKEDLDGFLTLVGMTQDEFTRVAQTLAKARVKAVAQAKAPKP